MNIKGNWETREVIINGLRLSPNLSQKIYNHSSDGFNWGYCGSGSAQLALAVLLRFTKNDIALQLYQDFKREFVAGLPRSDFEVDIDVEAWIDQKMNIFQEEFEQEAIA